MYIPIGVGAGKFLWVQRNLDRILTNLPEKYFNQSRMGTIFLRFLRSFRRLSEILPGFYGILPEFSTN